MTNKLGTGLYHAKIPHTYVDHLSTVRDVHWVLTHLTPKMGTYRVFTNAKAFWEKIPNKIRKRLHNAR